MLNSVDVMCVAPAVTPARLAQQQQQVDTGRCAQRLPVWLPGGILLLKVVHIEGKVKDKMEGQIISFFLPFPC